MDKCSLNTDALLSITEYVDLLTFRSMLLSCKELYTAIMSVGNKVYDVNMYWRLKFAKPIGDDIRYIIPGVNTVRTYYSGLYIGGNLQGYITEYYQTTDRSYKCIKGIGFYIDGLKYGNHYEYLCCIGRNDSLYIGEQFITASCTHSELCLINLSIYDKGKLITVKTYQHTDIFSCMHIVELIDSAGYIATNDVGIDNNNELVNNIVINIDNDIVDNVSTDNDIVDNVSTDNDNELINPTDNSGELITINGELININSEDDVIKYSDVGTIDPQKIDVGTIDPQKIDVGTIDPQKIDVGTIDAKVISLGFRNIENRIRYYGIPYDTYVLHKNYIGPFLFNRQFISRSTNGYDIIDNNGKLVYEIIFDHNYDIIHVAYIGKVVIAYYFRCINEIDKIEIYTNDIYISYINCIDCVISNGYVYFYDNKFKDYDSLIDNINSGLIIYHNIISNDITLEYPMTIIELIEDISTHSNNNLTDSDSQIDSDDLSYYQDIIHKHSKDISDIRNHTIVINKVDNTFTSNIHAGIIGCIPNNIDPALYQYRLID